MLLLKYIEACCFKIICDLPDEDPGDVALDNLIHTNNLQCPKDLLAGSSLFHSDVLLKLRTSLSNSVAELGVGVCVQCHSSWMEETFLGT